MNKSSKVSNLIIDKTLEWTKSCPPREVAENLMRQFGACAQRDNGSSTDSNSRRILFYHLIKSPSYSVLNLPETCKLNITE